MVQCQRRDAVPDRRDNDVEHRLGPLLLQHRLQVRAHGGNVEPELGTPFFRAGQFGVHQADDLHFAGFECGLEEVGAHAAAARGDHPDYAHFNAPAVKPLTIRRCSNMKMTMTGVTNTLAKAIALRQSE
jgi:hypothetical protein